MGPQEIVGQLGAELEGVVVKPGWGETALFYNPGKRLPNGVYFVTLKDRDSLNDASSRLSRAGFYRLGIGVSQATYQSLFGARPKRPGKGGVVATDHDFSAENILLPHPVYAWMSWVCVLSPSAAYFAEIYPLILEAHRNAVAKFNKKFA